MADRSEPEKRLTRWLDTQLHRVCILQMRHKTRSKGRIRGQKPWFLSVKNWNLRMTDEPSIETDYLDAIYRENSRELWAIFYSQCSDPERAYDAVQESFLKLHSYTGEPIRDPRAWLLRVGQNWLRDVARRKSSSCKLTSTLDEMSNERFAPEQLMASDENREAVRGALQQMLEDDRKVLVMKYALDWSSAQMAKVMACTAAAVDMRLSRARRRLAELLEEQGYSND